MIEIIEMTVYTEEKGYSEVSRLLYDYGAKIISQELTEDGTEIEIECYKDELENIEMVLYQHDSVIDHTTNM